MRAELRACGIEDPEPDPFSVLPSTVAAIEIVPPKPRSRYFKRMTDAEIDALFGHVMSSQEFEEKLHKERQSWRTAGAYSIGEGQP